MSRARSLPLALLAVAFAAAPARAQQRPTRIDVPPVVDGALDDPVWRAALVVDDFLQRAPREGDLPTEPTRVRLAYTETALYVGVYAGDSRPDAIVATVMKRDDFAVTGNDQFAIAIDSYNDGRNGFWFSTNPLGVRVDAQFFDEGEIWESDWDGAWRTAARSGPDGWTAELEIPFSTLRFEPADRVVMGINLFRRIVRTNEALFAPLIPLEYACGSCNMSIATKYVFEGIAGGRRRVQLEPYVLLGRERSSDAGREERKGIRDVGLDLRYGVTDNLRASLSWNTDFAQAEVDERQLDLSRFDLFFPEKRDFFLEDSGIFSFGAPQETEIFFSRRIGLARDDEGTTRAVPILAGGKLTGRAGQVEVGVLDVRTESSDGAPWRNYAVGRFKAGIGDRSYAGGIATSVSGAGPEDEAVVGADGAVYLTGATGVRGFAAGLGTDTEWAGTYALSLFREGERLAYQAGVAEVGEGFAPTAGFVVRRGVRKWSGRLAVPRYRRSGPIRRWTPSLDVVHWDDLDGGAQTSARDATLTVDLYSDDRVSARVGRRFESVAESFRLFGDVSVPAGEYDWTEAEVALATKPGRRLSGAAGLTGGGYFGGSRLDLTGSVEWKLDRHVTLAPFYSTSWIDLGNRSFTARLARLRGSFSLDTRLSVGALVQYENETGQLGSHLRLEWLFAEGTELFLVWNEVVDDIGRGALDLDGGSRVLLVKFTRRFSF